MSEYSAQGWRWTPYIFIAPISLYLLLFQGGPLVQELYLSFTTTSLLSPNQHVFVGLDNYRDLFSTEDFHNTILVTFLYTIACVVLAIGIGLATAPPVAVALIFSWMFNAQYGIFNHAQRALGIQAFENWLDSPPRALPAVLITTIWQIFPFSSVVILSALQGVSKELREAAIVDGAGRIAVFFAVVWPTIKPTVLLLSLFITIWSLRRFDLIWLMTQGGPIGATDTLIIELYRRAFVYRDLGLAAAVGMVGLCIALIVTAVYVRANRRMEIAEGRA